MSDLSAGGMLLPGTVKVAESGQREVIIPEAMMRMILGL